LEEVNILYAKIHSNIINTRTWSFYKWNKLCYTTAPEPEM